MATLRRSLTWSLAGNVVYNAAQWGLVVSIAQLGTKEMVGQFALAQGVAAPIFLLLGLNLRAVRATDVASRWAPKHYQVLRRISNVVSIFAVGVVGLVLGLNMTVMAVLLAVALAKSAEATSLLLYGYFQLQDRLDLVSRSLWLRAGTGVAGLTLVLALTKSLPLACLSLVAAWSAVYWIHDKPASRKLLDNDKVASEVGVGNQSSSLLGLARTAMPLGMAAGIGSLSNNIPRYAVQAQLGTVALGSFAAIAYFGQLVSMVTGSVADAVISRMARAAARRDRPSFIQGMGALLVLGAGVAGSVLLGAWWFGDFVISIVLGDEYVDQSLLIWALVGAALITLQRVFERGLQAVHRFPAVLVVEVVTVIVAALAVPVLVSQHGVDGAAQGLGLAFGTGALVAIGFLGREISQWGASGNLKLGEPPWVG